MRHYLRQKDGVSSNRPSFQIGLVADVHLVVDGRAVAHLHHNFNGIAVRINGPITCPSCAVWLSVKVDAIRENDDRRFALLQKVFGLHLGVSRRSVI